MRELTSGEQEWIEKQAKKPYGFNVETLRDWYYTSMDELKAIGLDEALCGDDTPAFIEMVKTAVISKLQANITVHPTEFEMLILGPHPEAIRGKDKKHFVEIVGFASMEGESPNITTISAWGDFVNIKNDVEPLESYKTGLSFFKDDRINEPNRFILTVQGATNFSSKTKISFMGESYTDKLENINSIVPEVKLGDVDHNLSRLKKSKNGQSYPDMLDLKRISVKVTGTNYGVDKNGREWAMYQVVDGTFNPTLKEKYFVVWVDPSIFERLQAGEGSFLDIIGIIQKDRKTKQITMSACFVHPLVIKPLERKDEQIETEQPGESSQPKEEEILFKLD